MHRKSPDLSWIFSFSDQSGSDDSEPEVIEIPEDLSSFDDDALQALETDLLGTFDRLRGGELSGDAIEELRLVTAGIERVREQMTKRADERAQFAAEAAALADSLGLASSDTEAATDGDEVPAGDADGTDTATASTEPAESEVAAASAAAEAAAVEPAVSMPTRQAPGGTLQIKKRGVNVPLSEVQRRAPEPDLMRREEALIVVAPDVPNVPAGTQLSDMDRMVDAVHRRARTLGNPSGQVTVATIKREFDIVLDREAAPDAIWDVMKRAADPKALVAAGGWCAPSTIIYDFFNIACDDGLIDVPTVGVTRGGIRWPTSPSIQSVLSSIWLWTETDDINAATGSNTKPCARVPCPTFNEDRLDCHGLCVTAGNLTESAYPELIANHLRLVMNAHRHVINQRTIADMVALSTGVTITGADVATSWGLLNSVGLQAADYREKFRMCDNDVLEVVLPRWAKEAFRADLAKRVGVENFLAVTDAQINAWFDARNVRVQWVSDWQLTQVGQTTPLTAWPFQVQFMIYAAGTFVVGNGLDLDLGVVRDSTLNAKNDHTAAWTEECNLTALIGHESRLVTVDHCVSGTVGQQTNLCGVI